ncbi:Uncharacterized conserved protein, tellurite resistance protein B (TerB) family [Tangfeifania diversioriginum]|uniref:Uncharacterized conserved protein, tellurite resistance protein B (TerB) family n=1 Tax=Tangfeifania diversioriginum TaxID=1168035 RepID=A0A1M6HYN4_9BACT|nr:TerB family tellurite resistance protein [Tangfeifania diversioriginum]SHJ27204.1 Uncharacterized conserved protein, tellurite resistance protein B (TerB) family [Tangfeifania diversioriginum]
MIENEKKMFLGLYQMLLADEEVHPNEIAILYQIGKEKGDISEEEIQRAIFSPNTFVSNENLSDDDRIEYLYNLSRIAWADGRIDDREKEILQEASKRLGFANENVVEISEFLLKQAKAEKSFEEILQIIKNS